MSIGIALAGNPNCGKDHHVQRAHRSEPVRGQLARRDGGKRKKDG